MLAHLLTKYARENGQPTNSRGAVGSSFVAFLLGITNVNPLLVTNYDLSPIKLGNTNLILDPDKFPILKTLKGKTLLTTDGTTLLGADDKAGVAIIMHFINEYLKMAKINNS